MLFRSSPTLNVRVVRKQRHGLAGRRLAFGRLTHQDQASLGFPSDGPVTQFGQFQPSFQRPPAGGLIDRSLQRLRQPGGNDVGNAHAF